MHQIQYTLATPAHRDWISANWCQIVANHMHLEDGFTILALANELPVGVISVYRKPWIAPLAGDFDGYIDIIEVKEGYRREGIARKLVEMAETRCREEGFYQIRAWSSDNKVEAIPMWKALGYGMCPTRITVGKDEVKVNGYYVVKVLQA